MRRRAILQGFLEALTHGDNALSARPINVQAHDPLRYLSDILAWLHQAVASEREIVSLVLGVAANSQRYSFEAGNETWLEDGTIISAFDDLVEKDLAGIYRPIQVFYP
jgi:conserved oligomeric Golgi complex subunit 6